MTKAEQKRFVRELTATIKNNVLEKIEGGYVPAGWDGFELRQYVADQANHCANWETMKKGQPRRKEYENTVLVNNL